MVIKYQFDKCNDNRIHQGDIFHHVPFYEDYFEKDGVFKLSVLEFPLAIILTQECDLEQNLVERSNVESANNETLQNDDKSIKLDKFLVSLLCAPLYNADQVFSGEHLSELKAEQLFSGNTLSDMQISTDRKSSEQRRYIKENREPRYHYIEFDGETNTGPVIIDFKHSFSISLSYLEKNINNRICSIKPMFREAISQRFSNYLSRIGLHGKQSLNVGESSE